MIPSPKVQVLDAIQFNVSSALKSLHLVAVILTVMQKSASDPSKQDVIG